MNQPFREVTIGPCRMINADMSYLRDIAGGLGRIAIVTDPPYGIGASTKAFQNPRQRGAAKAASTDYGQCDWDHSPATPEQIDLMRGVSQWQVVFGGNYFSLPPTRCWLVWDKLNGENEYADCELAWTNLDKPVRRMSFQWHGMLRDEKGPRIHPTQKPVAVMKWCIEKLPLDRVEMIVDPFAGSFSTGVAAMQMDIPFIGLENDAAMFDKAVKRMELAWQLKSSELPFEKPAPLVQRELIGVDA